MARFDFRGIDAYLADLKRIGGENARKCIRYAVYPGAGVVADAVKAEIVQHYTVSGDLARSLTLTEMKTKDGFTFTTIQFPGKDAKGVANQIKVAALESGTSRGQPATHFLSRTLQRVKDQCEKAMADALDEKIGEIMDK